MRKFPYNPENDGLTHINVYSKGQTELGRFLSNFAMARILTEDGWFASIEGYWYWLGVQDDRLRTVYGWEAKQLGRTLRAPDWQFSEAFKDKIRAAITIKINDFEIAKAELIASKHLPLTHYYVYGSKIINVPEAQWILDHIDSLRQIG